MNGGLSSSSHNKDTEVEASIPFILDQFQTDSFGELETPSTSTELRVLSEDYSPDLTQALQDSEEQQSVLPLLKNELKYKILYRRHAEGKQDIELEDERPRVYELTEDDIRRREIRRLRNKESAERAKRKEIQLETELKRKIDTLSALNIKLSKSKSKLMKQRQELLQELKEFGCVPDGVKCMCRRSRLKLVDDSKGQNVSDTDDCALLIESTSEQNISSLNQPVSSRVTISSVSAKNDSNTCITLHDITSEKIQETIEVERKNVIQEQQYPYEVQLSHKKGEDRDKHHSDLRGKLQINTQPLSDNTEQDMSVDSVLVTQRLSPGLPRLSPGLPRLSLGSPRLSAEWSRLSLTSPQLSPESPRLSLRSPGSPRLSPESPRLSPGSPWLLRSPRLSPGPSSVETERVRVSNGHALHQNSPSTPAKES